MERIFYKSDLIDEPSNVPVYIFDSSFLPSPEVINYDEFIMTLMTMLPKEPYTLVMFCTGLNRISWIWGIKFLKKFLLDEKDLQNINKIFSVHEGWFIKTLTSILTNYHFTKRNINMINKLLENLVSIQNNHQGSDSTNILKNRNLIINCSSLVELNDYVDITKLKISLNVFKHDYQLENTPPLIENPFSSVNFFPENNNYPHPESLTSSSPLPSLSKKLKYHIYQNFNIINNYGDKVELLFHRPGNKINSEIFINCIKRDQLLWINDWDLYCIATSFKKLIAELPTLIPIDSIELPIRDETMLSNFYKIVNRLSKDLQIILVNVFHLFYKLTVSCDTTKLHSRLLSKIFINSLSHQTYLKQNEPNLIIVNNFIRKLIDNWNGIGVYMDLDTYSIDKLLMDADMNNDHDHSYMNYDLTIDEMDSESDRDENHISYPNNNSRQGIVSDQRLQSDDELIDMNISPKKVLGTNNNVSNIIPNSIQTMKSLPAMTSAPLSPMKNDTNSVQSSGNNENSISVQYPPQKYKYKSMNFDNARLNSKSGQISMDSGNTGDKQSFKKPVIRGVKVGELAKLYEERAQGLELLRSL